MNQMNSLKKLAMSLSMMLLLGTSLSAQCIFQADYNYTFSPNGQAQFTDASYSLDPNIPVNAVAWLWTFGDGGTSPLQNPTHAYNGFGPYAVCVTITYQGGGMACTSTHCDTVVMGGGGFFFEDCQNGIDDDGDGLIDGADPDCQFPVWEDCQNGIDDDGDGLVDGADPDCQIFVWEDCFNGVDDDNDGLIDGADPDCGNPGGPCADLRCEFNYVVDTFAYLIYFDDQSMFLNGGGQIVGWEWTFDNGLVSNLENPVVPYPVSFACLTVTALSPNGDTCSATYCAQLGNNGQWEDCYNGIDDDGDGLVDMADPDCQILVWEDCYNGVDDDNDGLIDGADPDCQFPAWEDCYNGIDDDNDGLVDGADPDCGGQNACDASFYTQQLIDNIYQFYPLAQNPGNGFPGGGGGIWDFGDGSVSTDFNPVHAYANVGSYLVCYSIPMNGMICDTQCDTIVVTWVDTSCLTGGCVFPGDANYDQIVDMNDFLYIGLTAGDSGPARPNASPYWYGQHCTDWNNALNGVNNKHSDCDGSGLVDSVDVFPIMFNYFQEHNGFNPRGGGAPITLQFDQAVYVANNPNAYVTVGANVYAGDNLNPVGDIHGLRFTLESPAGLIVNNSVEFDNNPASWFSAANGQVLTAAKELPQMNAVDFGITRTSHTNVNGAGLIGHITFVVPSNFFQQHGGIQTFNITGTDGIDAAGNPVMLGASTATVEFQFATGIDQVQAAGNVRVFPNPAENAFTVEMNGFEAELMEIFNLTGQRVAAIAVNNQDQVQVDATSFGAGTYVVLLRNADGQMATQKVMVK